ncbi:hypothetical protein [Amycolatopsis sulphurea]|uniref:hypothetical protein n=1 Tax=Amycolatopsis sulphurea TaxID=76022 RepID=UPI000BF3ED69|nr:hypothetical protein [Amycolatopsis sulphurea]
MFGSEKRRDARREDTKRKYKMLDPELDTWDKTFRCLGCRKKTRGANLCGKPACSRAVAAAME